LNTDKRLVDTGDNLAIFISNIVFYCRKAESKENDPELLTELREKLKEQFNVMLFDEKIEKFSELLKVEQ
jgi:predicted house-cleaning noncanonical NTP pyrophosphatase (MazG superfamily)